MDNMGYGQVVQWLSKKESPKAKIEEELMCIAWHSSRWWDWYMPEVERKQTEKL